MRKLRKSWIGIVLVFLFGISLFFWRQGSYISNILNSDNVIAKVGQTPISTTKFNRTLEMNIQRFNKMLDKKLSGTEIKNFQIHQLALSALINDAILENEYDKLNFKLDDIIIAKKTRDTIPDLYDNNNQLNEIYLKQFLSQQRLKIEDIVQIIHFESRNNIFNEVLLDINYPSFFSKKIETYNNHQRDINYLKLPIESIDINDVLKENQNSMDNILNDYYEKNISKYMTEEERDIEYILIDKNNFINNFIPAENEMLEYYNINSDLYIEKEKRDFIQFNFKSQEKAQRFKNIINSINNIKEIISYAEQENLEYNNSDLNLSNYVSNNYVISYLENIKLVAKNVVDVDLKEV